MSSHILIANPMEPTSAELRSIPIEILLPQQHPFVMVDRLIAFSQSVTSTETTISDSNIFVSDGCLSACGLMENIAQSCAARIGYVNKLILKKGVQIGVIGAVRDYTTTRLPSVGDIINTTITVIEEVFGMILAEATVSCAGVSIASCQIKIALREETVA